MIIDNKSGKPIMGKAKKIDLIKPQTELTAESMEQFNVFEKELEGRKFVDALVIKEGNLSAAVRYCFPTYKGRTVEDCYKRGQALIKKEHIAKLINEEMTSRGVSVGGIINDILVISKEAGRDADKLRALELLGKFKKMFDVEVVKNQTLNLNISENAARRILERRDRYDIGDGGKFKGIREGASPGGGSRVNTVDEGGDSSVDVVI